MVVENRSGAGGNIGADVVVGRLNAEIVRVMRSPDVQARLAGEGMRFVPMTAGEFAAFAKAEVAHWAPVVRASGARAD